MKRYVLYHIDVRTRCADSHITYHMRRHNIKQSAVARGGIAASRNKTYGPVDAGADVAC